MPLTDAQLDRLEYVSRSAFDGIGIPVEDWAPLVPLIAELVAEVRKWRESGREGLCRSISPEPGK